MPKRLFPLIFLTLLWVQPSHAQYVWEDVERVVAVGDVHGAYSALVDLLQSAELIDADANWTGGTTHLVSLGDLLDRGPDSRQAMDLLMSLQQQAQASGGRVHVLLGNHEVMNLTGDLRDVSEAEHAALADLGGHAAAFAEDGQYGAWLRSLPFIIRINGTLFTHGGLPSMLADQSLEHTNSQAQTDLRTLLSEGSRLRAEGILAPEVDLMSATYDADEDMLTMLGEAFVQAANSTLLGAKGPLWYRGTAACHAILESAPLAATLAALNAQRVVVGHTPTPDREINARLDNRVYVIDTGMLATVYKGNPRVLTINGDEVSALDANGNPVGITQLPLPDPLQQLRTAPYEIQERAQDITSLTLADPATGEMDVAQAMPGIFRKLSTRDANRALAAYRLDRHLGLGMVPATALRKVGKHQGIIMAWPRRPFNEIARQQSQIRFPNWCANGSDYTLLAVFDALIGQTSRVATNLFYERGTMHIRITENFRAFGTSTKLPETAMPPVLPAGLQQPLRNLNEQNLTALLEDLLKPKEIRALLKRRDAILEWQVGT